MSCYVVDASVAMKWFLPEVHAEAARRLLHGEHNLLVPDLFFPEFGNILWKKIQRGELDEAETQQILAALQTISLHVQHTRDYLAPAVAIACGSGRTVYDSLYVALAVRLQSPLVTADERLYNSIASGPLAPHLLWVVNLPPTP